MAGVQSVTRALGLLRLLGETDDGLRVSDIARMQGLPVSTAHRLLTTLEQEGFAQFDPDSLLWHVGRQAFVAGSAYTRRRNFVAPALPSLRRLRDLTRETVNLGVLEGDQLVTLAQVESREVVRAISPPGGQVPVFCSGMGKAILSTWDEAAVRGLAERSGLPRLTPRSLRDVSSALAAVRQARMDGYALDDEEHAMGLRCVAAPVFNPAGEAVCAISVSGIAARMTPARMAEIGPKVRDAARRLTETLGGRMADLVTARPDRALVDPSEPA